MQYMVLTFAQPMVAHDTKLLAFLFLCGLEFRSGAKFRLKLALLWERVSQFAWLKQDKSIVSDEGSNDFLANIHHFSSQES